MKVPIRYVRVPITEMVEGEDVVLKRTDTNLDDDHDQEFAKLF